MNNGKRQWIKAGLVLMLMVLATGCSKKKEYNYDVKELAGALKSGIEFKDEMSELQDDMFEYLYEIDVAAIEEKAVYISTGATAEEIAVIKAVDGEKAEEVRKGLEQRVEDQKESFESYIPEEMVKLNDPVLETKGNYIILCISDNNARAKEIIEENGR